MKAHDIVEAIEKTRGNGNTGFLLYATQFTNVDFVVESKWVRDSFREKGFHNIITLDEVSEDRPFVLDHGVIHAALNEAIECIDRLKKPEDVKVRQHKGLTGNEISTIAAIMSILEHQENKSCF